MTALAAFTGLVVGFAFGIRVAGWTLKRALDPGHRPSGADRLRATLRERLEALP